MLQLFQSFEVFPMDGRSRIEPPLRSNLSRKTCRIEEDGSGYNTVFQSVDIPFRTTARGLDVLHRHSVVSLAVYHHVTVHGIQMAVNNAMIRACILVSIAGASRANIEENTLQDIRRIRGYFL